MTIFTGNLSRLSISICFQHLFFAKIIPERCATSKPSIKSSPWIRDAPHSGLYWLIRRTRSRKPRSIFGRPARFRDFQHQNALKPHPMPAQDHLRFHHLDHSNKIRPEPNRPHADCAIHAIQSPARWRPSHDDTQLMTEQYFSASSRVRDLNRLATMIQRACRPDSIHRSQDSPIFPQHANPEMDAIFGKDIGLD